MSMYIDIHELNGASLKDVTEAHFADVAIQSDYDVEYIKYWFNQETGKVFCLCRAPTAEAAEQVHRCSHGLVADSIIKIDPDMAEAFLGGGKVDIGGDVRIGSDNKPDTAIRTIIFTDIVESTLMNQRLGDAVAMELLALHDIIVRNALCMTSGREVKHTGDGIMASFYSADDAINCVARIQHQITSKKLERNGMVLQVRIGAASGEPVERHNDLFGTTIQLASRLCDAAGPNEVLVAKSVVDLCSTKNIPFVRSDSFELKGFEQPQQVAFLDWNSYWKDLSN